MKCGLILCSSLAACTPQASDTVVSAAVVPKTVKAISAPSPSPTGGYAHADPFAAEVQEAARFAVQAQAVDTHSRLIYKDVLTAQTQVVAGQNYLLSLAVTEDGKPRQAHLKVWRQLNNRYVLTQWDWMP